MSHPELLPSSAIACVLTQPGKFEIREVPVPKPKAGEILCRIRAVAICGSDPEIVRGDLAGSWPPSYPFIAGHEWAGEVVETGEGVQQFRAGDRVAGEAHKGCGHCENCLRGRYTLCLNYGNQASGHRHYGFTSDGAYAQYQTYSVKSVKALPSHLLFEEGALVDTASVALHGVKLVGITPGGTVVVIGPGPIGLCTMRLAKSLGSAKVVVVGRGARLHAAKQMGADYCVDFTEGDPVEQVRAITNGQGADEVFECSGAGGTLVQAIGMVRKGGRVSLLGVAKNEVREPVPFKYVTHNEILITGSRANPNTSSETIRLIASGQLRVRDMITHRFPLTEFENALDTFVNRRGNCVKVVILPNGPER